MRLFLAALLLLALAPLAAWGQRNLTNIPVPDPEEERKTFILGPGLEVNLFAADPLLAKPIHMNFDAQGRLWVASSEVYPQIKPGQAATDKIIVLEDTTGDGQADKTTIFADGLLIPTGVAPGDGGAYVANSTELLHLSDTNGDGRADKRRVVLSGFGTEDTHHILHSFRWGVEGLLYMNQSIYIHSHIETPYGVRRLDGGGIWAFRPAKQELDVLCRGFVNTWGHQQDRWGQSFATDGAYGEGVNYVFPGAVFVTAPGAKRVVRGLNPGSPKHCGLEIVSGRHFPDDWQGNVITNDFRAHRVCRFVLTENGSGYTSRQEVEVIKSNHVAFRPIDAKMGPDGALYIADWYNPIIQHGEVDFRDPRRDHVHGRIWRVTHKDRPLVPRVQIVGAEIPQLLELLKAPEDWVRLHAKRELQSRGAEAVLPQLENWLAGLDRQHPDFEHHRLEALWTYAHFNALNDLLGELLTSPDHRVRAAAVRQLSYRRDPFGDVMAQLEKAVDDEHPRVRLEAVRSLAEAPTAGAAEIAARALDHQPLDAWLDFALWQTFRDLSPNWLPALREGKLDFGGKVDRLTFALKAVEQPGLVGPLLAMLKSNRVPPERVEGVLTLIATLGGPKEMGEVVELLLAESGPEAAERQRVLLDALVAATQARKVTPAGDLARLGPLLQSNDERLQASAARALGLWKVTQFRQPLIDLALRKQKASDLVQRAAIDALGSLGDAESLAALRTIGEHGAAGDWQPALIALAEHDAPGAARLAAAVLERSEPDVDPTPVVLALAQRKEGPPALVRALAGKQIPRDVAKRAIRAVNESLRQLPELTAALQKSGGLQAGGMQLSPEEFAAVLVDVGRVGDAARGEAIYRRAELACMRCHAIAGAGGRVGPDMVSLGASAPVDYILDSLVNPNSKVKEGYHSKVVETADGRVLTGIPIRETKQELVLRDGNDQEISVATSNIEAISDGRSLMPDGAIDALTRSELVDLVRFLSELGKVGPYAVPQGRLVRSWRSLVKTPESHRLLNRTSFDSAAGSDPALLWEPAYSTVAGELPLAGLAEHKPHADTPPTSFVRFEIEVTAAGPVELALNSALGLEAWLNGQPVQPSDLWRPTLPVGRHAVVLAVNRAERQVPLRIELRDVANSPARAELATGK